MHTEPAAALRDSGLRVTKQRVAVLSALADGSGGSSRPGRRPATSSGSTTTRARFSTVAGEQGSPDTWRDPRGFALKFYTTEGHYDLVGNNTPVFFIRGLRDNDMQWDFWTLNPESAHQVTLADG